LGSLKCEFSEEGETNLEQALYLRNPLLVDEKEDNVITGLNNNVIVRYQHLVIADDCPDRRSMWQVYIFNRFADNLRRIHVSMRNSLQCFSGSTAK
jgi:hypothetical protein